MPRGTTVGRFVLLGTLGAGGMGVVYAAYDPELDRKVWIGMEFVAGQTLAAWAKGRVRWWSEILPVLADVARGVAAAHVAGLVHRDLKPLSRFPC